MAEQELMDALFADLPDERTLMPLSEPLAPDQLALACNAEMVASLLYNALRVRIVVRGHARAVVRHVKLMGLLCRATPGESKDDVALDISGPFALFRHTRIYGRALCSLLPRLSWCHSYRLEADCAFGDGTNIGRLVLHSGDPIAPARELEPFDSKVEERFARSFAKLAREWDVIREPRAIPVGDTLIFPDFELCHRVTGERFMLEIMGYWSAEYVRKKLAMLREARIDRLILCVDEERCCADGLFEFDAHVIRYRRKVDPRAVLAIVDPGALPAVGVSPAPRPTLSRRKASD
jgi:predicted nuclease of restriction endonuclease-like RecB superfamily